ncbi:hypothetical protein H5410_025611 [Solanum commersonii]|uniref:HMA domain-containing protein n=1 Tax=Solanum commersonii TaxID=4109 RepID=A0A9J5YWH3_SOLCO|nr:hypothetical protein H5410_025611 [Solanum commersonii]
MKGIESVSSDEKEKKLTVTGDVDADEVQLVVEKLRKHPKVNGFSLFYFLMSSPKCCDATLLHVKRNEMLAPKSMA